MTKEDLRIIKEELLKRKEHLLSITRTSLMSLQSFERVPADEADFAVQEVSQFMSFAMHTKDRMLLIQIEKTLAKIEKCEYGCCENCGEEINIKRLKAQPHSSLCVECKEDLEQESVSFA